LEDIHESYKSLKKICDTAKNQAERDWSFFKETFPYSGNKKGSKKNVVIAKHFDNLYQSIEKRHISELISTFERIVLERFVDTSEEIKTIVKSEYEKRRKKEQRVPLYHSTFIKTRDNIHNLSGIRDILAPQLSDELKKQLKEITEYRNWLSHGERNDVGKESPLGFKDIYEILTDIIGKL